MIAKRTINSAFMVPTIGVPLNVLKGNGYTDSYAVDGMRYEQYEDSVYLLFKPPNYIDFTRLVEEEYDSKDSGIIDDYDYEEGHVVLVYRLNPAYKTDFDLIRAGKYSKTSKIFQELFKDEIMIKANGLSTKEKSFQTLVFTKHPMLKDYWREKANVEIPDGNEYWTLYDINKETLKL